MAMQVVNSERDIFAVIDELEQAKGPDSSPASSKNAVTELHELRTTIDNKLKLFRMLEKCGFVNAGKGDDEVLSKAESVLKDLDDIINTTT